MLLAGTQENLLGELASEDVEEFSRALKAVPHDVIIQQGLKK